MAIAWPALWLMNTRGFRAEFATACRDTAGDPTQLATRGQPGAATDSGSIGTNRSADEDIGDGDGTGPGGRT